MVVDDNRHLEPLNAMAKELQDNVFKFNERANGVTDKVELATLRAEQNDALAEMIKRHRRSIDFMLGKQVPPETHFGDAVLLPVFGDGQ